MSNVFDKITSACKNFFSEAAQPDVSPPEIDGHIRDLPGADAPIFRKYVSPQSEAFLSPHTIYNTIQHEAPEDPDAVYLGIG